MILIEEARSIYLVESGHKYYFGMSLPMRFMPSSSPSNLSRFLQYWMKGDSPFMNMWNKFGMTSMGELMSRIGEAR